ncbi:MAG: hypothetical protein ACRDAX_03785 [Propionibacteriaceae bacterium]
MSFFAFDDLRRRPLPVAVGVTVGMFAVWILNLLSSGKVVSWLAETTFYGPQLWRPITFGLVSGGGVLSLVLSIFFGYWVISTEERIFGSRWTLLVALASILSVATIAAVVMGSSLIGGAGYISWGVISAATYRQWRRGYDIKDQFIILVICFMMNIQGGLLAVTFSLAATAGGIAADHLYHEVRIAPKKQDPYDAFKRQRQGKPANSGISSTMLVLMLCLALWLLWGLIALVF